MKKIFITNKLNIAVILSINKFNIYKHYLIIEMPYCKETQALILPELIDRGIIFNYYTDGVNIKFTIDLFRAFVLIQAN